jgi:hypothetical protein
MFNPFRLLWELITFGIQAIFVYILVIIILTGLVLLNVQQWQKVSDVNNQIECTRIDGCRILKDGTIEY